MLLLTIVPFLNIWVVLVKKQLYTITMGVIQRNAVGAVGMFDTEETLQRESRLGGVGIDPRILNVGTIGKRVATHSRIGRIPDTLKAQVEHAFEVVTIGIPHLTVTNRAFQLLQNGVGTLPTTFVNDLVIHIV